MLATAGLVPRYFPHTLESLTLNLDARAAGAAAAASEEAMQRGEELLGGEGPGPAAGSAPEEPLESHLDPLFHADQAEEAVQKLVLDPHLSAVQQEVPAVIAAAAEQQQPLLLSPTSEVYLLPARPPNHLHPSPPAPPAPPPLNSAPPRRYTCTSWVCLKLLGCRSVLCGTPCGCSGPSCHSSLQALTECSGPSCRSSLQALTREEMESLGETVGLWRTLSRRPCARPTRPACIGQRCSCFRRHC